MNNQSNNKTHSFRFLMPFVIFIVIAVFLWAGLKSNPHEIPSPLIGKPVPPFQAATLQDPGQTISNQDFKGHVSLLNVFATWCVSCKAEHPVLMDIKASHRVNIYGLNFRDKRRAALAWLEEEGDPYTKIIFDPRGKVGIDFGVYGTPETFVIDRKGVIRYKYIGPMSPDEWRDKILPQVKALEAER